PGGGKFESAKALARAVAARWPGACGKGDSGKPFVVFTGGEPLLQLDAALIDAMHAAGFEIAIETNGTCEPPPGIDWICVSPKAPPRAVAARGPGACGKGASGKPFVVFTGGEPLLQLDAALIDAMHAAGFEIAIETNGTCEPPPGIDWICVSPKADAELALRRGDELKLIFPQLGAEPERYEHLSFRHFFLQPMDGPDRERNTRLAVEYCLVHPRWRLSLQTQKYLGIP